MTRQQAASLAARLERLEWNGSVNDCFDSPQAACIGCSAIRRKEPHADDCEFVALLAELRRAAE